jgi:muramidase (phage lysozyme)
VNTWTPLFAAAGLVLVVAIIANRRADLASAIAPDDGFEPIPDDPSGIGAEQAQPSGGLDAVLATLDPATYIPAMTEQTTADANRAAMLMTIRKAEGTAGPDGYRTMFGYRYFTDFSDHPRQPAQFTDKAGNRLWTSAAGAYQFMAVSPIPGGGKTRVDTWDRISKKLGLPDFSPESQDAAALALILEAGAMNDVDAGRFDKAIGKIRGIWASLPGAGYGQPERKLADLRLAFTNAGGTLA